MRVMAIIIGVMLVVLGVAYGVLFTQTGNDFVRPHLEKKATQALGKKVDIREFSLRFSSLKAVLKVDESATLEVQGTFNLFDQRFAINYDVQAQGLETPVMVIQEKLTVVGEAKGFVHDFVAQGMGKAFGSDIAYEVTFKEKLLSAAQVEAKDLDVGQILELLGQSRLAEGKVSVEAHTAESGTLVGKVTLSNGVVNAVKVQEQYGVVLPPKVMYAGELHAILRGEELEAKGALVSSLAEVRFPKILANTQTQVWSALVDVIVPNLALLEPLAGMPLAGDLTLKASLEGEKEAVRAEVSTASLGGLTTAFYEDDVLDVSMENGSLEEVLTRLAKPRYSQGALHVKAKFTDASQASRKGTVAFRVANGVPNSAEIRELFGVELPAKMTYEAKMDAKLAGESVDFVSEVMSSVGTLQTTQGKADLKTGTLNTQYQLHVEELLALKPLIKQALHGSFEMNGEAGVNEQGARATGVTEVLGGKSSFVFENEQLDAQLVDVVFERLSALLDVPYVFESVGNATLTYNVPKDAGVFQATFPQGRLIESELTRMVQTVTGFNLTQELYENTTLKGKILPNSVIFDLLMKAKRSQLSVSQGTLGRENEQLRVPFDILVEKKDLSGIIEGKMQNPRVSIKASQYIQKKLDKEIEKHVPDEAKGLVRDLLKLF
ncbi:MAG: hypothetical protein IBX45_02725 [Campylobacterales bacterium]|nr:hypothetical protein [Campylobacterales bacterium]